jgi:hypothetical protein
MECGPKCEHRLEKLAALILEIRVQILARRRTVLIEFLWYFSPNMVYICLRCQKLIYRSH